MKKIKNVLSAIVLVVGVVACGSKSNNNSNANPAASDVYARCGNDQNCINQYFSQQYGPNSQGYYQGNMGCGGGYQCQVYQVPQYSNGCNQGCGTQQYVVAPQGAYIPQYGIQGNGGSFYMGFQYRR
ncbi:MAG: hypothetical protein R3A80_03625 [Bdellovibrionota bacterium]